MSAHPVTQPGAVEQPPGPDDAGPTRAVTITLTGFAASALDLGGDLYLLDLDGMALHYESYISEATSWSCLRDGDSGELVEVSEATSAAIDALMSTFDAAYSQRHGEIEAVAAAVVSHALACCHPVTYVEQALGGDEQFPTTGNAAGGTA